MRGGTFKRHQQTILLEKLSTHKYDNLFFLVLLVLRVLQHIGPVHNIFRSFQGIYKANRLRHFLAVASEGNAFTDWGVTCSSYSSCRCSYSSYYFCNYSFCSYYSTCSCSSYSSSCLSIPTALLIPPAGVPILPITSAAVHYTLTTPSVAVRVSPPVVHPS